MTLPGNSPQSEAIASNDGILPLAQKNVKKELEADANSYVGLQYMCYN